MPNTDSDHAAMDQSGHQPSLGDGTDNSRYDFGFQPTGVYAQVVSLLREFGAADGVHLDIGCGYGAIAEHTRELGLTYVGADLGTAGLESLAARGFAGHELDLRQPVDALAHTLRVLIGDRRLASMSIIDTLEHITNGPDVLAAMAQVAAEHPGALLVVAVPNVTHRDLGIKLVTGRWDYTSTGLLDDTHVIHHTEALLTSFARSAGWVQVGAADVVMGRSDQHFPDDLVTLSEQTTIGRYLGDLTRTANPHAVTNEFVRAFLVGAASGPAYPHLAATADEGDRPFLSVIMRTQGRRRETLVDAITCLQGQESQDFELIVLPHKVSYDRQLVIERVIDDLPDDLRARCRIVLVDDGGRSRPLNVGVENARGRYLAILDDDDLVLGNWVSTFKALATAHPGRVLRGVAVEQDIEAVTWPGEVPGVRTVSATRKKFTSQFDLFDHLVENHSPPVVLAFPRSVFHDLGIRFDETLNVLEDWDVLLRSALRVGVADSPEIIGIYRRWAVGEASHTLHGRTEWLATEARILAAIDQEPHVFPGGTIEEIRRRLGASTYADRGGAGDSAAAEAWRRRAEAAERHVEEIHASTSWRVTKGMRTVTGAVKRLRRRRG